MTLECVVVMAARFAGFAGLAMSYCNGKGFRQDGSKAKPVHKVRDVAVRRKLLPGTPRFEKYYCSGAAPAL
jgi:hypothetical protein